jgi:hypothetical protein
LRENMPEITKRRIATATTAERTELPGATRGVLTGISDAGMPLVDHCSNPEHESLPAVSTVPVSQADIGKEVVLLFEDGDARRPLVIGIVQAIVSAQPDQNSPMPVEATIDGHKITLSAENEIVLRCGASSLTLTRAGKILIRGAYVSSYSSGVNRIKGGSVQIN